MGTTAEKLQAILNSKAAIKAAIEAKGVENVGDVLSTYPDAIASISTSTGSGWTGHADVEGLKAIGWTDEDIAYYQEHGVNWNEEDDEYHKVPEDNKALYGVINIGNVQQYKDILVYLPKIDTTGVTSMSNKFQNCYSLVAVPMMDTSSVTSMSYMFQRCYTLASVPLFDTSSVTSMSYMFQSCYSLVYINLNNLKISVDVSNTSLLEKSSLLYMIENAAPTSAITITLSAYCYNKYNNDPDVLAALSAQPLVSLASA